MVTYLDVMVALMLAFRIGFLFRLPYIGSRIAALGNDGHFVLESQPWMRRTTFIGLIAFVVFPLAATGGVGGSILGRLLGMTQVATFAGICVGSFIGNGTMYAFAVIHAIEYRVSDGILTNETLASHEIAVGGVWCT